MVALLAVTEDRVGRSSPTEHAAPAKPPLDKVNISLRRAVKGAIAGETAEMPA